MDKIKRDLTSKLIQFTIHVDNEKKTLMIVEDTKIRNPSTPDTCKSLVYSRLINEQLILLHTHT